MIKNNKNRCLCRFPFVRLGSKLYIGSRKGINISNRWAGKFIQAEVLAGPVNGGRYTIFEVGPLRRGEVIWPRKTFRESTFTIYISSYYEIKNC